MKKKNGFLAAAAVILTACCLTACSSGGSENDTSPESDMPQISVDLSEEAQTTPENTSLSVEETSASSEETTLPEITTEEETTDERHETVIIEETSTASDTSVQQPAPAEGENAIAKLAAAQEGKPFYFGGADPETGFDNSGLIYYVLNQNGVTCPRLTFEIAEMGEKIGYDELQEGDVVFFEYEGSGKADFGGIYIGGGMMIVSTDEDRPVSKVDITTNYYQRTFQYGIKIGR